MAIASSFGWDNPLTQFIGGNRNSLIGIGNNLMQGQPFTQGLQQSAMADDMVQQREAEKDTRAQTLNQTVEWMKSQGMGDLVAGVESGGLDVGTAWQTALQRLQPKDGPGPMEINGQLVDPTTGQVIGDYRDPQGAAGNVTYGVNPIYGMLEDGTMGMGVMGDDGTLKRVDTGGMTPLGPYDTNALKAAGTAYGKGTGQAQFDVPAAELTMHETLGAIQDIRNNKAGMEEQFSLGGVQQMLPAWPGTEKANFRNAVTRGADQAFLQAREMLRGGGQITDFEGRKAENAITNMTLASQSGNKAAFEAALNDFEQAVQAGYAKLVQQSSTMPGFGGVRPSSPGNVTSTGLSWSIEP